MKGNCIFTLLSILLLTTSCDSRDNVQNHPPNTPVALQEKSSVSRSRSENLIEELYAEIVEKDSILQRIEKEIEQVSQMDEDSTESYKSYNQKNKTYYNNANLAITI